MTYDQYNGYLRYDDDIDIHGVKLPHWNQDYTYIFITFRLGDSLPQDILAQLKVERKRWLSLHPEPWDRRTKYEYQSKIAGNIEKWIDKGYGSCLLKEQDATDALIATMYHDDGEKYELTAYVIMPNHIHALIMPNENIRVETIMQEWKSVSSHVLKKLYGTRWCGWMDNYHDRMIRNEDHFNNVVSYILNNYRHGGVKLGGSIWDTPE